MLPEKLASVLRFWGDLLSYGLLDLEEPLVSRLHRTDDGHLPPHQDAALPPAWASLPQRQAAAQSALCRHKDQVGGAEAAAEVSSPGLVLLPPGCLGL